jgi:hypothetical protein
VPNAMEGIRQIIAVLNVLFFWAWGTQKIDVGKRMARAHPLVQIS